MAVIVSILRGINVGGNRKVPMALLKKLYEEMGFEEVTTYIQSGNVICSTGESDSSILSKKITAALLKKFKFDIPVIIRTEKELKKIILRNPFVKEQDIDVARLHVTFLEERPAKEQLAKVAAYDFSPDRFVIDGKEVFLHCPEGYGITKINNNFFESKLKLIATTRNWKTVNELYRMANAMEQQLSKR